MRLKKFADERTDDSVQRLHEDLEDSNQRQQRFKEEYLKSKNSLENTESLLEEAKQRLAELEGDIEEKDKKVIISSFPGDFMHLCQHKAHRQPIEACEASKFQYVVQFMNISSN